MRLGTRYAFYSIVASSIPLILLLIVLQLLVQREAAEIKSKDIDLGSERLTRVVAGEWDDLRARAHLIASNDRLLPLILKSEKDSSSASLDLIDLATDLTASYGVDNVEIFGSHGVMLAHSDDFVNFNIQTNPSWLGFSGSVKEGVELSTFAVETTLWFSSIEKLRYNDSTVAYIKASKTIDSTVIAAWETLTDQRLELRTYERLDAPEIDDSVRGAAANSEISVGDSIRALVSGESPANSNPHMIVASGDLGQFTAGEAYGTVFRFASLDGKIGQVSIRWQHRSSSALGLLDKSLFALIAVGLISIALSGLIGYWFSRRLVVPVNELVESAEMIARGKFDRKIIWFANDEMGTLVNGFNTMYDRLRRSQEKLVESEKIAAWNQMARKVAHEIKNPLTPIQLSIEDMKRSYDSGREDFGQILDSSVETISSEISRLKRLTEEFSQFARLPAPKPQKLDIRKTMGDALRIYPDEIRTGKLRLTLPKEPCMVEVDSDLFIQALNNLVKNALEAVPEDGQVKVTGEPGRTILRVIVEDNGAGIPDENVEKLFTPYFTTKKKGTGLGLVIAYRIIFDHAGKIRYEKAEPSGSRFIIVLPLARDDK